MSRSYGDNGPAHARDGRYRNKFNENKDQSQNQVAQNTKPMSHGKLTRIVNAAKSKLNSENASMAADGLKSGSKVTGRTNTDHNPGSVVHHISGQEPTKYLGKRAGVHK